MRVLAQLKRVVKAAFHIGRRESVETWRVWARPVGPLLYELLIAIKQVAQRSPRGA
jgi:hypothetical protein